MMNRQYALLLATVFGLGVASLTPALAQSTGETPPPAHEGHPGPGGPGGGPGGFFKMADGNNDGFLTKEEMRAAQEKKLDQMFEHLDTDKDGKLSKAELEKGRKEMHMKFKKFRESRGGEPNGAPGSAPGAEPKAAE